MGAGERQREGKGERERGRGKKWWKKWGGGVSANRTGVTLGRRNREGEQGGDGYFKERKWGLAVNENYASE